MPPSVLDRHSIETVMAWVQAWALRDRYASRTDLLAVSLRFGTRIDGDRSGWRKRDALLFDMNKSCTPHEFRHPAVLVGSGVVIPISQADEVECDLHQY